MHRPQFSKLAAIALVLAPLAAAAHHAVAMYDSADPVILAGTVKSFEMGNPHSWLTVTVPGQSGGATDWLVECNPAGLLERAGWSRGSITTGDRITVTIAPHFDGIRRGEAIRVVTAEGATLNNVMAQP